MYSMTNYYFLLSALPPLKLGMKPDLSFKEVKDLLALNLTAKDMEKVDLLLRPIDLYNLRAFWLGEPLDDRGRFTAKELEEELLVQQGLPPYIAEFLERYESTPERLRYFSSLYVSLYRDEPVKGFLLEYYRFERALRLVLTGLRAKKAGRDLVRELQFEDPTDPLVAEILAQKESSDFIPPSEFEDLKAIFMDNHSDPEKLNRAILQYKFNKIEEMEENQDFSIDRVLAYLARLMLAESVAELNQEKGKEELSQYE